MHLKIQISKAFEEIVLSSIGEFENFIIKAWICFPFYKLTKM